jgi:hypothetical protein
MAISRMNMERQMRNMGGIMGLEDQRQGYFLGKLVKKITKPIKKIVKSPLGKMALLAGGAYLAGGFMPGGGGLRGGFSNFSNFGKGIGSLFRAAGTRGVDDKGGFLRSLIRDKEGNFSLGRAALSGLGAASIAAPFFMGGDEEVDEGTPFTSPQADIEDIRNQAKAYYSDPTNSALYFMPPKSAVQRSFYAADGGLATMRPGYNQGEMVEGIETVADDENMMMAGMGNVMRLFETPYGFDKDAFEDMLIQYEDSGAKGKGIKLYEFATDFLGMVKKDTPVMDTDRVQAAEGGIMDLGGLEKDYREGGFVPLGAEERADDVPARLSKNEFVFTADAVRAAGQGDIDQGAEVMQNMMDNLEAGGTISEESQGMENPAQEMFDQSQMLESRIA